MALTLLNLNTEVKASAKTLTLNQVTQDSELFLGLKSASGKMVTPATAMRASCVLACIRILMEDIAALPLILKRNTPNGPVEATDHPLYRLLKIAPNAFQTSVEVREHLMMDALLFGKWAAWVERKGNGDALAIHPLLADRLTWQSQAANGDLQWDYSSQYLNRKFTQEDLWRGNIMSRSTFEGQSLILLAREAIGLAIAAEEQGARLFSHGIQSDLVITSAEDLGTEGKENLKDAINKTYGGSANAFRALLLEGGLDVKRIGLTAVESQYLEARNYQLSDIARMFRIPSVMLGILNDKSNTYASTEQFFLSYEKHSIRPWCNRIEQTISRDLLLSKETDLFAKHDLTDLLRADMKTRYEAYALGINAGFINLNEPRVWEGLPKDPRLDVFLRLLTTIEVGQPNPAPKTSGEPNDDDQETETPPNSPQLRFRVAAAADAIKIVAKEQYWFKKHKEGLAVDGFSAWHISFIADCTGASPEVIREYSEWRFANTCADTEAKQKLIKMSLGAL